jgi:hypothetical protein
MAVDVFSKPVADKLESDRDAHRCNQRLAYDCFKARVCHGDEGETLVECRLGKAFAGREDGKIMLISILRGRTPKVCQTCEDYDDGGKPEG